MYSRPRGRLRLPRQLSPRVVDGLLFQGGTGLEDRVSAYHLLLVVGRWLRQVLRVAIAVREGRLAGLCPPRAKWSRPRVGLAACVKKKPRPSFQKSIWKTTTKSPCCFLYTKIVWDFDSWRTQLGLGSKKHAKKIMKKGGVD